MTAPADKPLGASLGWRILGTSTLFEGPWLRLRCDRVRVPPVGEIRDCAYVEHPGSVFVVPRLADGRVVLIRSYRYPLDAWCWEVPAGSLADRPGAAPERVALDELAEEVGGTCASIAPLGTFAMANGFARCAAHFFVARGVELDGSPAREPGEHIAETVCFGPDEVLGMIGDGRLNDGDSALALLLALRGDGR